MAQPKKILFIEDNNQYREMFAKLLTASGFEVQEAADGVEGLSLAQIEGGFNLILTDLKMPHINGLELVQELKTKPTNKPNGPIVALTSVTQEYIKDEVIRRGAVAVLAKDEASPDILVEKIKEIIDQHPLQSK